MVIYVIMGDSQCWEGSIFFTEKNLVLPTKQVLKSYNKTETFYKTERFTTALENESHGCRHFLT